MNSVDIGHEEIVKILITNKADINAKGNFKGSPLQIAATKKGITAIPL